MTSLRELGEFGFINKVAQMAGAPPDEVVKAIEDDCAVVDVGGEEMLLVTTDAGLEGRHFDLSWMTPFEAAQRTVAGAVSDIAAMGGRPFACLCTSAIPSTMEAEQALDLMRGMAATAQRYGAPLIGGDTVAAPDQIMLDIIVLGWAKQPWLRSGARPGDKLVVTGHLGDAGAALELLLHQPELINDPQFADLRQRMMDPTPRIAEAAVLAQTDLVHAAIDISDGLYQDAGHIAQHSGVRIEIAAARLPVTQASRHAAQHVPGDALWWAATSGEEYELLLAVDRDSLPDLTALLQDRDLEPLTDIGDIVAGEGVVLIREDGSEVEMERGGWDHFKATDG